MRLADIPARLVEDTIRKWRRRVIAIAVIAICALVAVAEGLAALRLALEGPLGPVWARVVLVGIFVTTLAATVVALRYSEQRDATRDHHPTRDPSGPFAKEERVSMIAEAIDLGYSLARDFRQPAQTAPAEPEVAPDDVARHKNGARPERRPGSR